MSARADFLPCPVCLGTTTFDSVQSLNNRLIYVCNNNVKCPVCDEELFGLHKYIIHLFSHIQLSKFEDKSSDAQFKQEVNKKSARQIFSDGPNQAIMGELERKNNVSSNTPIRPQMKYVKIFPKLPTVPQNKNSFQDIQNQPREAHAEIDGGAPTMESNLNKSVINTTCDICSLQFVDKTILKLHKCIIHNVEEKALPEEVTRYHCQKCPKHFKMRGSLMVHLRMAHSVNSNESCASEKCLGNNVDCDQTASAERDDGKQWQCEVCKKHFTTKYFLKKHNRLHTGETPYSCGQCNKTFTFQQSYHKHLLYHNDAKPHACSYCGRAFKELSTLHNHQRIHTGEKPFACENCGKCFRQRVSYLVHRRIHTGVMPYKCTACEKSFRYKVSQRTHKCKAQPPGTVVRQTGNLIEKLRKKCENSQASSEANGDDKQTENVVVSDVHAELVRTGAKLSLEDTETENFSFIDEAFNLNNNVNTVNSDRNTLSHFKSAVTIIQPYDSAIDSLLECISGIDNADILSPTETLKNLCLSKDAFD